MCIPFSIHALYYCRSFTPSSSGKALDLSARSKMYAVAFRGVYMRHPESQSCCRGIPSSSRWEQAWSPGCPSSPCSLNSEHTLFCDSDQKWGQGLNDPCILEQNQERPEINKRHSMSCHQRTESGTLVDSTACLLCSPGQNTGSRTLVRMQSQRNAHEPMLAMQNDSRAMQDKWAVSYETKCNRTTWTSSHVLFYQRNFKTCPSNAL